MIRTHEAGTLRAEHVGQTVTLAGWVARRRDHGGVAFIDLRDASGVVQVVVRDEVLVPGAHDLRNEYCVAGRRRGRPRGPRATQNPDLPTGEIEVIAADARGAQRGRAAAVPDRRARRGRRGGPAEATATSTCAGPAPAAALRLRSEVNQVAREVLDARDFVEIETPDADPLHARRAPATSSCPARLQPGLLVRPAAEPAAVQAAAHGRRHGALLPDRPLLPRRGLPRRPAAGVHPARHRDELRRAGRRDRAGRGRRCVALWRLDRPRDRRRRSRG